MNLNEAKAKVQNENPKSVWEEDVIINGLSYGVENYYDVDCYDGFAIGKWTHNDKGTPIEPSVPSEIVMMYPELADVLADKKLEQEVLKYRGLWDLKPSDITFGDIMMTFGEVV